MAVAGGLLDVAKAAAPVAVGAGLLAAPEDAQAGLYNTGAGIVRRNADVATRDMSQERGGNRGERKLATRVTLSGAEKDAIRASIKGKKVNEQASV